MSSAGAGAHELLEEASLIRSLMESVKNQLDSTKKLLQFGDKCAAVRVTGESVLIVHRAISHEVLQYKQKENRIGQGLRLAEAMAPGQTEGPHAQLYLAADEAREIIAARLRSMELRLQQATQERAEWLELAPFINTGFEWVTALAEQDPEELENQLEEAKIKVEAGQAFILQLREEWDAAKGSLNGEITAADELVETLLDAHRPL